jgi:hypothetical protein
VLKKGGKKGKKVCVPWHTCCCSSFPRLVLKKGKKKGKKCVCLDILAAVLLIHHWRCWKKEKKCVCVCVCTCVCACVLVCVPSCFHWLCECVCVCARACPF